MILVSIREWFFIDRLSTDSNAQDLNPNMMKLILPFDNTQIDRFQFISLDLPRIQIVQTVMDPCNFL
jgi:hypothetical protein